MLIVNQDFEVSKAIEFNPQADSLYTVPVAHKGVILGINIYCRKTMLGTFDNLDETVEEINNILSCPHHVYVISGYSVWHEWEELCELMRGE